MKYSKGKILILSEPVQCTQKKKQQQQILTSGTKQREYYMVDFNGTSVAYKPERVREREEEKNVASAIKRTKCEKCLWSDSKMHRPCGARDEIYSLRWTRKKKSAHISYMCNANTPKMLKFIICLFFLFFLSPSLVFIF